MYQRNLLIASIVNEYLELAHPLGSRVSHSSLVLASVRREPYRSIAKWQIVYRHPEQAKPTVEVYSQLANTVSSITGEKRASGWTSPAPFVNECSRRTAMFIKCQPSPLDLVHFQFPDERCRKLEVLCLA